MIAAAHAVGFSVDDQVELARTFASPKKLLDRTLPLVALMVGRKVTDLYQRLYGDALAEDLWLPFFAISSDLTRAAAVVHRTGPLWEVVRASTAMPAVFPPLLGNGSAVLVDGGVMNNMPLDVMRELCEGGTVIGVNPMPAHDKARDYSFGSSVSGFDALLGRLRLFGVRTRAPSILGSVMRATEINSAHRMRLPAYRALADVLIEPPVGDIPDPRVRPVRGHHRHSGIAPRRKRSRRGSAGRRRRPRPGRAHQPHPSASTTRAKSAAGGADNASASPLAGCVRRSSTHASSRRRLPKSSANRRL